MLHENQLINDSQMAMAGSIPPSASHQRIFVDNSRTYNDKALT